MLYIVSAIHENNYACRTCTELRSIILEVLIPLSQEIRPPSSGGGANFLGYSPPFRNFAVPSQFSCKKIITYEEDCLVNKFNILQTRTTLYISYV